MDFIIFLVLLFSIIFTYTLKLRKSSKLPPGPLHFPIIGNILQVGSDPHRSLAKLSKKYGPVMSLKLGGITTIVISSPEAAKVVLQKHDLASSSRSVPGGAESLDHDKFSIVWLPVDNQWRKLRKICKEQLFAIAKLDANQELRTEKLQKLFDYVKQCSESGRVVDLGEAFFTTTLNLLSASTFSTEFAQYNSDSAQEMKDVVSGMMKCLGKPNFADFFPVLKPADPQGILRETRFYFQKIFDVFDRLIDEKLKSRVGGDRKSGYDMVDALIEINQKHEGELSRNDIKHLLLDLLVAGTDTTSGSAEWAMAELLRNPDKMARVRNEINDLAGENGQIQESDISRLPYLQAVVKETFRLHPIAPLLAPHKAVEDMELSGYIIPKNARILVNIWAMGRDPCVWPNADSFIPERFLDQNIGKIDFKGQDFELIPFGAGRRICPGLVLGHRMAHMMLATLVHKFDWKLEKEAPASMDMSEKFRLALQKATTLMAIPSKL